MKRFFGIIALVFCILAAGCSSVSVPTSASTATLQFSSSPEGAQIYLDSQYHGTTPSSLSDITPGTHTLEFRYTGYESWKANITVPKGSSSYFASLTPLSAQTVQPTQSSSGSFVTSETTGSTLTDLSYVTVKASKDIMIIGSTQTFSGTCTESTAVILMLYGPGAYTNGVKIAEPTVGVDHSWTYTWNPGTSVMHGSYTLIAYNKEKTVSDKCSFTVVGGGTVSIATSSVAISQGDTVSYSGLCTSGSTSVRLTLYGPGQYSNGVDVTTLSLKADNTWSYRFKFDQAKPLGTYTMYVHDAQNTGSDSVAVTLNSA